MFFSLVPLLPLKSVVFKVTTVLVVITALAHQLYFALYYYPITHHHAPMLVPPQQQPQQPASFFGACLLVKDDNELLYEWIAYHYTVLPLRFLVVGKDVNSTHDPVQVLQRWKKSVGSEQQQQYSTTNTNATTTAAVDPVLHYWVLDAEEFQHRFDNTKRSRHNSSAATNENFRWTTPAEQMRHDHHALIHRQKGFLATCAQLLQRQGVQWTAFIDSDEFVVPNVLTEQEKQDLVVVVDSDNNDSSTSRRPPNSIRHESLKIRSRLRPIGGDVRVDDDPTARRAILHHHATTVLDVLWEMQQMGMIGSCYTMPRLVVGALENRSCPDAPESASALASLLSSINNNNNKPETTKTVAFNYTNNLSTLRYIQHAKKGDFQQNKFGKVFLDLSRITTETLATTEPRNIHRPYRDHCGPAGAVHFFDATFYATHYVGSWDRYKARPDGRRNRDEWEKRAYLDHGIQGVCDTGITWWHVRFVALMGAQRAGYLLGGAPEPLHE